MQFKKNCCKEPVFVKFQLSKELLPTRLVQSVKETARLELFDKSKISVAVISKFEQPLNDAESLILKPTPQLITS